MKGASASPISTNIYQTVWHHIPEDSHIPVTAKRTSSHRIPYNCLANQETPASITPVMWLKIQTFKYFPYVKNKIPQTEAK